VAAPEPGAQIPTAARRATHALLQPVATVSPAALRDALRESTQYQFDIPMRIAILLALNNGRLDN